MLLLLLPVALTLRMTQAAGNTGERNSGVFMSVGLHGESALESQSHDHQAHGRQAVELPKGVTPDVDEISSLLAETSFGESALLSNLQAQYLATVRMGILGGLNHAAHTNPNRGASTDLHKRGTCLNFDWFRNRTIDECLMKWDANERLLRIEQLYRKVRNEGVAGDLMECGVWRGGATVYMKALLRAFGDESHRRVWVSDSFNGVPDALRQVDREKLANVKKVPKDINQMNLSQWGGVVYEPDLNGSVVKKHMLTVEQEAVRNNFIRFGLLDDGVKFLPGYFNEVLPTVHSHGLQKIAVLRVDGDLYSSTRDVLDNLYELVTPGGFVVFDDYPLPQSRRAIEDFFHEKGLDWSILQTDRITLEEKLPGHEKDEINVNAYFQKPGKI
jgi:hypothetical protein